MARDPTTGRLLPGETGNPGGRPGTSTARTFAGRRARRALLEVLEAVGPGLTVIVLDARGLVLSDGAARRAGLDSGAVDGFPLDEERAAEAARVLGLAQADSAAEEVAIAALLAEGWREVCEVLVVDGGGRATISRFAGPGGELLGWMAWRDLVVRRARALRPA